VVAGSPLAISEPLHARIFPIDEQVAFNMVLLLNYRKLEPSDPDLSTQLDAFDHYQQNDEDDIGHQGLDLNSPLDVFHAVLKQVGGHACTILFYLVLRVCIANVF
jgi:hypothetical protein